LFSIIHAQIKICVFWLQQIIPKSGY
jgi:hypothetical protein